MKKSWANMLNESLNSGKGLVISDRGEALSEGENENDFFEDLESRKGKRRGKKDRKFGSLLEMQNRNITVSEKRKRDKTLRSRNLSKQLLEEKELSGKPLSDSDIKSKCSILVKEAREVLKLGNEKKTALMLRRSGACDLMKNLSSNILLLWGVWVDYCLFGI
ncbi:hypothetical protein V6N13_108562 [Hibiscus sabdariffa]